MRRLVDFETFDEWFGSVPAWPVGIAKVVGQPWEFAEEGMNHIVMAFGQQDTEGGFITEIETLLAFRSKHPDRVSWRVGSPKGRMLGECSLMLSSVYNKPLVVHDTPLDWLRAGCKGVWPVDDESIDRLRDLRAVSCSAQMETRIRRVLSRMPKFNRIIE